MKRIKTIILAQLALLGILLCISAPAWANLAANTQIINSADLSYFDGAKTQHATATVTVTVSLVSGAPTIDKGGPYTTSYSGCGTTLIDSFLITAGSNGPDTYNLSAAVVPGAPGTQNSTGPSAAPTPPTTTVFLGATVTTVNGPYQSSGAVLIVPFDGTADTPIAKANGIVIGSTVVIKTIGGDQTKQVINIQENVPIAGLTSITVNSTLSPVPAAGVLVAEQKTVTTTVTSGCIITSGTDVTVTDTLTATSGSGSGPAMTSGTVLNTYTSGNATLTKYVRNVTTSAPGTLPAFGYGSPSNSYYLSGVTAKPGEILEYLLVAKNTTASGTVSSAVITDAVPIGYVTFKTGEYPTAKDITYVDETGAYHYLTVAGGDDAGVYVAPNLTVNVGTGATILAGGSIAGNQSVAVLYQVTLLP
jgi:hypothetical protein